MSNTITRIIPSSCGGYTTENVEQHPELQLELVRRSFYDGRGEGAADKGSEVRSMQTGERVCTKGYVSPASFLMAKRIDKENKKKGFISEEKENLVLQKEKEKENAVTRINLAIEALLAEGVSIPQNAGLRIKKGAIERRNPFLKGMEINRLEKEAMALHRAHTTQVALEDAVADVFGMLA